MKPRCSWAAVPWVTAALALAFIAGASHQAQAQVCGGAITNFIDTPGPYQVGDIVTIRARFNNTEDFQSYTVDQHRHRLDCADSTNFFLCQDDGMVVSFVDVVSTSCEDVDDNPVVWNTSLIDEAPADAVDDTVLFTPAAGLPFLEPDDNVSNTGPDQCNIIYRVQIDALSNDTTPKTIQWANRQDGTCENDVDGGADGAGVFQIAVCEVELDKQVSCDGEATWFDAQFDFDGVGNIDDPDGNLTQSTACIGWNESDAGPAEPVHVRWLARNTGDLDLNCTDPFDSIEQGLGDTNPALLPDLVPINIPVDSEMVVEIATVWPDCSDDLDANEPDTATLNCFCEFNQEVTVAASDMDSARFECQTPGLGVSKLCEPQDENGENAIEVSYTNQGDAALTNCTLTDIVYAGECEGNPFDTPVETVAEDVPVLDPPNTENLVATTLTTVDCEGDKCCNKATVTCDIVGAPQQACVEECLLIPPGSARELCLEECPLKQISGMDTDDCEIPVGDCYTRTPGRWGTHPADQEFVYANFGPVSSCGVDLVTSDADTAGSGTEDICSIGGGKKSTPQTDLSNTQRQLERQCAAANLNLAASALLEVSCEAAFPGIENLVARCCNDVDSVCVSGDDNLDFTVGECISMIDFFNNEPFGDADADPIVDGPADPSECKDSKKSGYVNGDGVRPGDRS